MPIYEYECAKCRYYLEVIQKISDSPLRKCPSCGRNALKKLMSAPAFRLKGSGWYETDFKSDQERKRNIAGAEKDEAKGETKTETPAKAEAPGKGDATGKAAAKADTKSTSETKSAAEAKPAARPAAGRVRKSPRARARPVKAAARRKRR